MGKEPITYIY